MNIAVASGKGGTGKTTIAVSLALSIDAGGFYDCDVEGPNANIFLRAKLLGREEVFMYRPVFDKEVCRLCGKCASACRFSSIVVTKKRLFFFDELCHGCGLCAYVCPNKAISEEEIPVGFVEYGVLNGMEFVQGRLLPGEAMAPLVIRKVKKNMKSDRVNIIDVPAGNACPMREAIKGADFCILVAEPTPFGLHDLRIAVNVLRSMEIPMAVIVNKANDEFKGIDGFCKEEDIEILMRIPFDKSLAYAYANAEPIVKAMPRLKKAFDDVFTTIKGKINRRVE